MDILEAENFLNEYGNSATQLAELYDRDASLGSALCTLFPGFEYPDFSHLTMKQIGEKYARSKRSAQG